MRFGSWIFDLQAPLPVEIQGISIYLPTSLFQHLILIGGSSLTRFTSLDDLIGVSCARLGLGIGVLSLEAL